MLVEADTKLARQKRPRDLVNPKENELTYFIKKKHLKLVTK